MASPNPSSAAKPAAHGLARTLWPAVLAVTLAGIVAAFQIGKLPAALPTLRADLGLSLVTGGWVISTFSAVGVATGMLWGFIADRIGHRRVLAGGMAVVALGTLSGAMAVSGGSLIATRLVEGCGYIAVLAAGPSIISALSSPRDRSLTLGIWAWYMPLGLSVMVLASPFVIEFSGWRGLWRLNALLAVLAGFLALWAMLRHRDLLPLPAPRKAATTPGPGILSAMWQTVTAPGPPVLAVCFGAYSLIYLSVSSFLPTFLIERQGYDTETAAYLVALTMVVNAPGCVAGAWLLRRGWSPAAVIALAYLGMLACVFGIFADDTEPVTRLCLATFMPFIGGLIPPAVLDRAPAHAASPVLVATCIGLIIQALSFGQLIGPPILASLVDEHGSWEGAIWMTGPAGLVGLAAAAILWRLEKRLAPSGG